MEPFLKSLYGLAGAEGDHFFLWRLPKSNELLCLVSPNSRSPLMPKNVLSRGRAGFLVHGFEKASKEKFFFEPGLLYRTGRPNRMEFFSDDAPQPYKELWKGKGTTPAPAADGLKPCPVELPGRDSSKSLFMRNVWEAVAAIKERRFEKLVISRQKTIAKPKTFDVFRFFESVLGLYSDSFVALVHSPLLGTWVVASPEVLLDCGAGNKLQTVALAGTQLFREGMRVEQAKWSQKEIEEQALVTKYIIEQFKSIRLREFDVEGPRTVRAGNVLHLKSFFTIDLGEVGLWSLPDRLLGLLHPTSAVCGLPQGDAERFIRRVEPHRRVYYTGYLGPVNVDSASQLFVNIRTMRLFREHLVFYSGTGITRDSEANAEWNETEWKIHALFKAAFF